MSTHSPSSSTSTAASSSSTPSPAPGITLATPYVLGIDMGGTAIKAAAFTLDGTRIATRTAPTGDGELINGHHAWAVRIRSIVADFARDFGQSAAHIGLSAPGLAARDRRSIASLPNRLAGIEGFDWTAWLGTANANASAVPRSGAGSGSDSLPEPMPGTRRVPCPAEMPAQEHITSLVPVLNDAHAALRGEVWQGAARNRHNVIMLTLGTGVGGAAMVDGHLLRGHLGRAGHLGHVTVHHNSRDVSIFGMPGALETAIGNYSVPHRSGGTFADSLSLVEAATRGDAAALAVWERSVHALACAISSFINAFDPEIVVLGGGIADAGDALWSPLRRTLDAVEWRPFATPVPIVPAQLGGWAGTYGAAFESMNLS